MAQRAIRLLDNYEIRPGCFIGVCLSLDNCRLFVGSLPNDDKDKILDEIKKVSDIYGLADGSRAETIHCD